MKSAAKAGALALVFAGGGAGAGVRVRHWLAGLSYGDLEDVSHVSYSGSASSFMFVYEPAILKQGHTGHVILIVAQATVGVVILAAVLQRYFFGRLQPWQAVMLFAAALLLIYPDWRLTLAGLASTVVVLARQATRPAVPVLSAGK